MAAREFRNPSFLCKHILIILCSGNSTMDIKKIKKRIFPEFGELEAYCISLGVLLLALMNLWLFELIFLLIRDPLTFLPGFQAAAALLVFLIIPALTVLFFARLEKSRDYYHLGTMAKMAFMVLFISTFLGILEAEGTYSPEVHPYVRALMSVFLLTGALRAVGIWELLAKTKGKQQQVLSKEWDAGKGQLISATVLVTAIAVLAQSILPPFLSLLAISEVPRVVRKFAPKRG